MTSQYSPNSDFNGGLIQTRAVLDTVVFEARDLYTHLRHDPKISAALRKRILGLFTNATLKMLARVQQLQESDGILTRMAVQKPKQAVLNDTLMSLQAYMKAHPLSEVAT